MLVLKFLYKKQKYQSRKISINGKSFNAIIADTTIKRIIGLMYRKSIAKNQCMLFIFDTEEKQSIWMYSMNFAIDVLWVDSRFKIVDIKENFLPCKSILKCKEYRPKRESKYVIELPAGIVNKNKILYSSKIGGII